MTGAPRTGSGLAIVISESAPRKLARDLHERVRVAGTGGGPRRDPFVAYESELLSRTVRPRGVAGFALRYRLLPQHYRLDHPVRCGGKPGAGTQPRPPRRVLLRSAISLSPLDDSRARTRAEHGGGGPGRRSRARPRAARRLLQRPTGARHQAAEHRLDGAAVRCRVLRAALVD